MRVLLAIAGQRPARGIPRSHGDVLRVRPPRGDHRDHRHDVRRRSNASRSACSTHDRTEHVGGAARRSWTTSTPSRSRATTTIDAMRRDVRSGAIAGGVVVPDGYGDDPRRRQGAAVELIPDPSAQQPGARAGWRRRRRVAPRRDRRRRAVRRRHGRRAISTRRSPMPPAWRLVIPSVDVDVLVVGDEGLGGGSRFSYSAMSNLVLFVFVNTVAIGALLATDRAQGLIRRLFASPEPAGNAARRHRRRQVRVRHRPVGAADPHRRPACSACRGAIPPAPPVLVVVFAADEHGRRAPARLAGHQHRAGAGDRRADRHRPRHARRLHVAAGDRARGDARGRARHAPRVGDGRVDRAGLPRRRPRATSPASWPCSSASPPCSAWWRPEPSAAPSRGDV